MILDVFEGYDQNSRVALEHHVREEEDEDTEFFAKAQLVSNIWFVHAYVPS